MIVDKIFDDDDAFFIPLKTIIGLSLMLGGCTKLIFVVAPEPVDIGYNTLIFNPYNFSLLGVAIFLLMGTEVFFWLDKSKPKPSRKIYNGAIIEGDDPFWFTVERKLVAFFDTIFLVGVAGIIIAIGEQASNIIGGLPAFIAGATTIIYGLSCIVVVGALLYGYILLNSRKYKEVKA